MLIGLERAIFGNIPQGIENPQAEHYSIVGRFFHDTHLYAHYSVGGNNTNFHPIAACSRAVVIGIAAAVLGSIPARMVPKSWSRVQTHFRVGLEGAGWIYAASIIYSAAQGWTAATKGQSTSEQCRE